MFSDSNDQGGIEQTSFGVDQGKPAAATVGDATVTGGSTTTISLTGTLADLDALIAGNDLTYTP